MSAQQYTNGPEDPALCAYTLSDGRQCGQARGFGHLLRFCPHHAYAPYGSHAIHNRKVATETIRLLHAALLKARVETANHAGRVGSEWAYHAEADAALRRGGYYL
jgi:hypothetical protein